MVSVNQPEYWENRYQEGTTRWDLGQAAPPLVSLLKSPTLALPIGRVAVLGCGRGYDALLFAAHCFEVVGFDFAAAAIAEAKALAQATKSSAQFVQRDIFDLSSYTSSFDYVVEHTCFSAIEPAPPSLFTSGTFNSEAAGRADWNIFTHPRAGGPPFGVTPAEIHQYFAKDFEILALMPVTNSVPERQGEEHLGRFQLK